MKTIFYLFILTLSYTSFAQDKSKEEDDIIYSLGGIEVLPEFPGGMPAFYQFIADNFKTPAVEGLMGKVFIEFVIEKNGSISNVKLIRDIGFGTGKEAMRVIQLSPNWKPGTLKGEPIRARFLLPISIGFS